MRYTLLVLSVCLLALQACSRKDDPNAGLNQKPLAKVNVKDVTLADPTNLISTVRLFWTGSDADGFVRGFRLSVNGGPYTSLINRTDSLFRFTLTAGDTIQTIVFRVVAVDNLNSESEPAEIRLPVRNSPPRVSFNALPKTDTLLGVITLPFLATDPDGDETLDSAFIRLNGGAWYALPKTAAAVYLLAADPRTAGVQNARVFYSNTLSSQRILLPAQLPGLEVGGANTFEMRVTDLSRTSSPVAQVLDGGRVRAFFLRRITSDLLLLDAHNTRGEFAPEGKYFPTLNRVYPAGFDYIDLTANGGQNQPPVFVNTMGLLTEQYPKVFWYSDEARLTNTVDNTQLLIETASPFLAAHLSAGRKLLVSAKFPDAGARVLFPSTPLSGWLPIDSLQSQAGRINNRSLIVSLDTARYPNLRSLSAGQGGVIQQGVDTFFPSAQADSLYAGPLVWTGGTQNPRPSRAIGGKAPRGSAKPSLIFFTVDLDRQSGDEAAFDRFFNNVLNRDFN